MIKEFPTKRCKKTTGIIFKHLKENCMATSTTSRTPHTYRTTRLQHVGLCTAACIPEADERREIVGLAESSG